MYLEQGSAVHPGRGSRSTPLADEQFPGPAAAITVMVASCSEALHAAWVSALACQPGIQVKGKPITDASRLATCVEHDPPTILLLDKALLDCLDPQSLRTIRAQCRHMRVLLLGDDLRHGLVDDVLRHRFNGLVLENCGPDTCRKAIRAVSKGELWLSRAALAMAIANLPGSHPGDFDAAADAPGIDPSEALTPRELQVVALLRRGCINKEIARELGIMEDTVKKHLQSVFTKLGVRRRTLVAMRCLPV